MFRKSPFAASLSALTCFLVYSMSLEVIFIGAYQCTNFVFVTKTNLNVKMFKYISSDYCNRLTRLSSILLGVVNL